MAAEHPGLPEPYRLVCEETPELLFTENETNPQRLFGAPNGHLFVKDAFHEYLIAGERGAVNPARRGRRRRRTTSGRWRPVRR